MIEDQELRDLFNAECEEHLQKLDAGLLHLEKNPDDAPMLKELFREAHSLKGAARMLGVGSVETLAHCFEDLLGAASRRELRFSPEIVDRLMRGMDDIRLMVREAITGEPPLIALFDALARMKGEAPHPSASSPPIADEPVDIIPPPAKEGEKPRAERALPPPLPVEKEPVLPTTLVPSPTPSLQTISPPTSEPQAVEPSPLPPSPPAEESGAPSPNESAHERPALQTSHGEEESARIDTIRVEPRKLDFLLNQAAELSVIKNRVRRRLAQIEDLTHRWEEQTRQAHLQGSSTPDWQQQFETLGGELFPLRHAMYEDVTGLDLVSRELEEGIRNLRLMPLSTLFNLFPRMVREFARQQDKQIQLILKGGETTADKRILEEMKAPLTHLLRNAVHHGIESADERQAKGKSESGTIQLRASRTPTHIVIEVSDDGRGLDLEAIRNVAKERELFQEKEESVEQLQELVFLSGFSTMSTVSELSGRGVGLDAVRTNVEHLKGSIRLSTQPDQGCTFIIRLPITLATTPVFIVSAGGQQFALPLDFVHSVRRIAPDAIFPLEGRPTIDVDGIPIPVNPLAELLELPLPSGGQEAPPHHAGPMLSRPCILLASGDERLGIVVDDILDELEVVTKPQSALLRRVRNVSGVTIMGSGEVCTVLNPMDLIKSGQSSFLRRSNAALPPHHPSSPALSQPPGREQPGQQNDRFTAKHLILLVEDSITTRTQEKRILEGAGYEVVLAVDGVDAINKLSTRPFDAVVTDIQMPNLDGLALTAKIRQNKAYQDLPIILVTSLATDDDLRRGMEAGANAYITKSSFDQKRLLETLRRLT